MKYHEAKPDSSPWDQTDYIILFVGIFVGVCCVLFPAIKLVSPMWILFMLPVMLLTAGSIGIRHRDLCIRHKCGMEGSYCPACCREENQAYEDEKRELRITEVMEGIRRAQVEDV